MHSAIDDERSAQAGFEATMAALTKATDVAVRGLIAQVLRQVDDHDSLEGAALHANTAADAERLSDERDFRILGPLHAELPGTHDRAELLALLVAFLRFAP